MRRIPLTKGKVALVDDEDFDRLSGHVWFASFKNRCWYAARTDVVGKRRTVYMHREILRAVDGVEVDHENHDGLDNRRKNLRLATHLQNVRSCRKRLGRLFKGVSYDKRRKKWYARIFTEGVGKSGSFLGYFRAPEDAARAYDAAARAAFGEFAVINFGG